MPCRSANIARVHTRLQICRCCKRYMVVTQAIFSLTLCPKLRQTRLSLFCQQPYAFIWLQEASNGSKSQASCLCCRDVELEQQDPTLPLHGLQAPQPGRQPCQSHQHLDQCPLRLTHQLPAANQEVMSQSLNMAPDLTDEMLVRTKLLDMPQLCFQSRLTKSSTGGW